MACANLSTDSCFALWNNRVGECYDVNAFCSHALCKLSSFYLVIHHNRYAWVGARDDVEAFFYQQIAVVSGGFFQMVTQLGAFLEHIEHLDACACDGWSQGVGEEVWTASLSEQVDDFFTTGGVAAGCAAECFAQGAGDDVNTTLYTAVLCGTTTMFAYETNCMAVVDHNQSIVFVCQVANTLPLGGRWP
mgnify:FL=1